MLAAARKSALFARESTHYSSLKWHISPFPCYLALLQICQFSIPDRESRFSDLTFLSGPSDFWRGCCNLGGISNQNQRNLTSIWLRQLFAQIMAPHNLLQIGQMLFILFVYHWQLQIHFVDLLLFLLQVSLHGAKTGLVCVWVQLERGLGLGFADFLLDELRRLAGVAVL